MDDFDRRVGDLLHLADYVANAFPQDKRRTAMTAALMAIHFVVHEDLIRQELVEVRESVTRSRQGAKGGRKGRATKPGPRLVALVLKMRPALSEQPFRRFVEAIRERSGWEDLEVDASGIEYRTVETGAGRRKAWTGSVLIDGEPIDAGTLERAHRRQRQRLRDDAKKKRRTQAGLMSSGRRMPSTAPRRMGQRGPAMDNQDEVQAEVVGEAGAAKIVGLAPATLNTLRCRGGGPPFAKLGRRVVYRVRDLRQWRDERLVSSTAEQAAPLAPRGRGG